MRYWIYSTMLACGLLATAPTNANVFHADDVTRLVDAMEQAEDHPGPDTIQLAPRHVFALGAPYDEGLALPQVTDTLHIAGHGSTLKWVPDTQTSIFNVAEGGKLLLRSLTIKDAGSSAIVVDGELILHRTRFMSNVASNADGGALRIRATGSARVFDSVFERNSSGAQNLGWVCDDLVHRSGNGGAVFNAGKLLAARVAFIDNRSIYGSLITRSGTAAGGTKFIPNCPGTGGALHNRGRATVINATFLAHPGPNAVDNAVVNLGRARLLNITASASDLKNAGSGKFLIGNSALRGGRCTELASLGHNVTAGDCQLDMPSDLRIGSTPSELFFYEQPNRRVPVLMPPLDSPLLDAGATRLCPPRDALDRARPRDGDLDGVSRCDVGAVERQGCAVDRGC